jgi:hypothetical protein
MSDRVDNYFFGNVSGNFTPSDIKRKFRKNLESYNEEKCKFRKYRKKKNRLLNNILKSEGANRAENVNLHLPLQLPLFHPSNHPSMIIYSFLENSVLSTPSLDPIDSEKLSPLIFSLNNIIFLLITSTLSSLSLHPFCYFVSPSQDYSYDPVSGLLLLQ